MPKQPLNNGYLSRNKRVIDVLIKKIPKSEGIKPNIYADPKGIPTMGIGVALGRKNGESDKIEVFSHDEVNRFIRHSGSTKKLTPNQYEAVVAAVKKNKKPIDINEDLKKIPFTLTEQEIQKQFDALLPRKLETAEKMRPRRGLI